MKNDFFEKITKVNNSRDNIYDDNYNGKTHENPDDEYYEENQSYIDEPLEEDYEEYEEYEEKQPRPKKRRVSLWKRILKLILIVVVAIFAISVVVSLFLPSKTNLLIMATDEAGTRTDTIIVVGFDKKTKSVSLLSVPRDSFITVSDEAYEKMNSEYPEPGSKSMKINTVHHFGGEKYGVKLLVDQVEEVLGCKINFYIKVNFDAFKYIIDSVGGIDFYVPQNMEYHDPVQDLHISLSEGMQHLNGDQAEQVVRFRSGYANQDLGRVSVQQDFMKACISQVITPKNLITKPFVFINVLSNNKYVDTNINMFTALPYAFQIIGIDVDTIESNTLPGKAGYAQGQSVYIVDENATREIVEKYFE